MAATDPTTPAPTISREALKKLGQQFANKIGNRLQEADLYLNGAGKLQLAEHKSHTKIPDDEPLIMRAAVGTKSLVLNQDIYATKRGNKLYVSLGDFVTATDLAIAVKSDTETADGWFVQEDQRFHLDAKKLQATVMGKTEAINPIDLQMDGDNIMVSTDQLEKWFGLSFDYNFSSLTLLLTSAQPLPAEAAFLRRQKEGSKSYVEASAKLPEQKVPYAMLSQPYFDTNISGVWQHAPGSPPTKSGTWSTIMNNDIAGFNAQTYASGPLDRQYPLSTARIALGKQDVNGNLLGPLHATAYQFGDITPVSIPLIGGGSVEQGFVVTNRPHDATTSTSTQITGTAQPGWDVEIYRNSVYIGIQRVDINGLYDFKTVDLVLGRNDIKLLFYGPRGEIHEEHREISVDPGLLAGKAGYYSASVSRNDLTVYQPEPPTAEGTGDINLAGTYQYGIAQDTTLDVGVRHHNEQGTERTFAEAGISSYLYGTYLNAATGVDTRTGDATTTLTARRSIGDQSALLEYGWTAQGYNVGSPDAGSPVHNTYRTALSGPIPGRILGFGQFNYSLTGALANNYDGSKQYDAASTLSTRMSAFTLSGGLNYNRNVAPDGNTTETASALANAHGFIFGGNWRIGTQHDILPITQLKETSFQYDHALGENMDTVTEVRHLPLTRYTDTSLALNWRTAKATISPTIAMDTDDNLRASVNVHFGSAASPYSHKYTMYNNYMTNVGGVAARVFQDVNGNGVYDEGDELMPDVVVRAAQVHRNAITDARGVAFLPDILQNTLTDITVDPSSLKDPYGISLFQGVSLRTHPGSLTQLEFPIVTGGETDGQAEFVNENGERRAASRIRVSLIAPDGKVEKTTTSAYDGYYAMSAIHPGVYYLTVETNDDSNTGGAFTPRLLEFKPGGTTLFGQGISLAGGYNTEFIYSSENPAPTGEKRARVVRLDDIESQKVFIRLGQYHSRLAMTFSWYKFKIRSKWGHYFTPTQALRDVKPDPKTQLMDITLQARKPMSMQAAADICQRLKAEEFQCSVKVITKYRNSKPIASAASSKRR